MDIISFLNKWLVYTIYLIWLFFSGKTLKLLQMIFLGVPMELENYMGPWISYMWHPFYSCWSWIWPSSFFFKRMVIEFLLSKEIQIFFVEMSYF